MTEYRPRRLALLQFFPWVRSPALARSEGRAGQGRLGDNTIEKKVEAGDFEKTISRGTLQSILRAYRDKVESKKKKNRNSSAPFSVFPGLFALCDLRSYQICDMHGTWSRFSVTEARTYQ